MLIINMVSEVWNSLQESFNCLCLQTVPLAVTLKVQFSHQKCLCLQDATNNRRSMLQVDCRQKHIFKTSKNDRRSMLQVDRQQTVPFALQHSPRLHSWSFPKHHATSGHCHQNNKNDCRSTLQTIVIENLNCLCLQTVPLASKGSKRSPSKAVEARQNQSKLVNKSLLQVNRRQKVRFSHQKYIFQSSTPSSKLVKNGSKFVAQKRLSLHAAIDSCSTMQTIDFCSSKAVGTCLFWIKIVNN